MYRGITWFKSLFHLMETPRSSVKETCVPFVWREQTCCYSSIPNGDVLSVSTLSAAKLPISYVQFFFVTPPMLRAVYPSYALGGNLQKYWKSMQATQSARGDLTPNHAGVKTQCCLCDVWFLSMKLYCQYISGC